eukprot:6956128-Ditylum_brightwellii.AAC.1
MGSSKKKSPGGVGGVSENFIDSGVADGSSGSGDNACDHFVGMNALQKKDALKKLKQVLEKEQRQKN